MQRNTLLAAGGIAVALLIGAWQLRGTGTADREVELLDPARVVLIRTPGGFLQVGEMRKAEEFAWQTTWECPLVDCSGLPRTVSRIRVKAHYVYRIPLAAEWKLQPAGDHYTLRVPPVQLQEPVAFDTTTAEIATEQSFFSPAAAPNREKALRYLGPELAQRGASSAYLRAQQQSAEQTIQEFARKWMLEQGGKPAKPIQVEFTGASPL